jgi:hypothetical protein
LGDEPVERALSEADAEMVEVSEGKAEEERLDSLDKEGAEEAVARDTSGEAEMEALLVGDGVRAALRDWLAEEVL